MRVIDGCAALITGASAGIGREFARQLASRAKVIVLVARRRERLEELRNELKQRNPNLVVSIRESDFSDHRSIMDLVESLRVERIEVDLLINNAGLGDQGLFATSDVKRIQEMVSVNITSLTLLTRLLVPGMIAQKRGAILNVSSSAGFLPIAGVAVYAATKAFVTSFSEAIRAELRDTGIRVTTLCPGPVDTEFAAVAKRASTSRHQSAPGLTKVSTEEVVRVALEALEHDKPIIIPGFAMKVLMFLNRLTPAPALRLVNRIAAKQQH